MELIEWLYTQELAVPTRSDARPKGLRLDPSVLELPPSLTTSNVRAASYARRPGAGAISVDGVLITAEREGFRALGMAFLAYALSAQDQALRIMLSENPSELAQLVVWPTIASELESGLGFRQRVAQISYRARLPEKNPDYLTTDKDRADYPREHLPHCQLGSPDVTGGGLTRAGELVCAHFQGTAPSLVWIGKYLLDLALEDCNADLAYLYNYTPAESMAPGSAELRLTVGSPTEGPQFWPLGWSTSEEAAAEMEMTSKATRG